MLLLFSQIRRRRIVWPAAYNIFFFVFFFSFVRSSDSLFCWAVDNARAALLLLFAAPHSKRHVGCQKVMYHRSRSPGRLIYNVVFRFNEVLLFIYNPPPSNPPEAIKPVGALSHVIKL